MSLQFWYYISINKNKNDLFFKGIMMMVQLHIVHYAIEHAKHVTAEQIIIV
jgi:hypothetical protein